MTAWSGEGTFGGAGTLSNAGTALKYLAPDADSSDGSWIDKSGGTSLFASIDELSVDDTDFIISSINPSSDTCKIRLSDPGVTPDQPFIVQYRYKKTGSQTIDLRIRLLQATTEIASWTQAGISETYTTGEQTLSGAQFAAITDFNDLFIEFQASVGYEGPGDVVSGANGWWGLRAFTSATKGNNLIRLRRDGDNAEQNFASLSTDGSLDVASIATFLAGASSTKVTVVKLYDQAGSTGDMIAPSANEQPLFVLSGLGALPVMNSAHNGAAWPMLDTDPSFVSVASTLSTSEVSYFDDSGTVASRASFGVTVEHLGTGFSWVGADKLVIDARGNFDEFNAVGATWRTIQQAYNASSSVSYIDGAGNNAVDVSAANFASISWRMMNWGGRVMNGLSCEAGWWNTKVFTATEAGNLDANQSAYWGI